MKKAGFICPVCGFNKLLEPPFGPSGEPSHEICPCCGFEFGFDDIAGASPGENYRLQWLNAGAAWFDPARKPKKWDLKKQLRTIGK